MRDHEIFREPFPVDVAPTVERVPAWSHGTGTQRERFVPLASGRGAGTPGWVVYGYTIEDGPEVEIFCSGDNSKMAEAAAVWRQGHLLHFGFEESPAQLNENGRKLLLNAIVYIARFTDDRPILDLKSPQIRGFYRDPRRLALDLVPERLTRFEDAFADGVLPPLDEPDLEARRAWFEQNVDRLRPDGWGKVGLDDDARRLDAPPADAGFFARVLAALDDEETRDAAIALLERSVADGPGPGAGAEAWKAWHDEVGPFCFFSPVGGFRWHVDPLARRRGLPTASLRGAARASRP